MHTRTGILLIMCVIDNSLKIETSRWSREVGEVGNILENIVKSYKIIKKRKRNYQKSVLALDLISGSTF